MLGWKAPAVLAGAHADQAVALDQCAVDVQHGDAAAGKAQHQQAAAEGDAAQRFVEHVAAHRVGHHVGAAAAGGVEHGLAEAGGRQHRHAGGGPIGQRGHPGQPLGLAGGGDHPRAQVQAQLHAGLADAAARAVHQQGVAALQPAQPGQRHPGGQAGDGDRRGFVHRQAGGQRAQRVVRHHHLLGQQAVLGA